MKTLLIISTFFLVSCSHKTIGKNCERVQESVYSLCDSLNGWGN